MGTGIFENITPIALSDYLNSAFPASLGSQKLESINYILRAPYYKLTLYTHNI